MIASLCNLMARGALISMCVVLLVLPAMYMNLAYHYGIDMAVCDYISGMTDVFAVETFKELFIPAAWMVK